MILDILRACGLRPWQLHRLWRLKARIESGEVSEYDRTHRYLLFYRMMWRAGCFHAEDGGPLSPRLRLIAEGKEWRAAA